MAPWFNPLLRRLNALLFYLLFAAVIGLLGWLSIRYEVQWDWTAGGRNSLSEASQDLLRRLRGPVKIQAFAQDSAVLREPIRELVGRYQRHYAAMELSFVNPDLEPELTRTLGISQSGQLWLEYQGRNETLGLASEEAISNALQRLALAGERWVGFVTGHGERAADGQANHDLGQFGKELERKGYRVRPINLTETPELPKNLSLLAIAGPRVDYLPGEAEILRNHLRQGGRLLWLLDPGPLHGLEGLAQDLGLRLLPGTIVDVNAYDLGIKDPAMALITQYPDHPAVRGINQITLFPHAAALEQDPVEGWQPLPLLNTLERTWNETGPIEGEIRPDSAAGERAGPLAIGQLAERDLKGSKQKALVIGDGDFLANAYLGNGGNLDLGINLVRWLAGDDNLLDIPAKTAPDLRLELSEYTGLLIGLVFLLILPLGLFGTGLLIWWRRRNR